ncbi:aspartate/glutamate racemase family protein [Mycobacterium sp. E1747]|uniref:aspartate/glutamate racemase family protein n=1 Tax=Mycobacterium sp. E1747 TaxID=1834128 RepID=UPI0007FF9E3C|nr:aspartate/glutamate racemase family protein [Mycobacterium sp. E1747]OBH11165.1 hypothetical protein A5695_20375 [Mycobacterium sp. E1747]
MRIANLLPTGYAEGFDPAPELLGPGVSVEPVMMDLPALPTNAVDLLLTDVAAVEASIRAQASGFDGIVINSVADYGLRAARSAVRIPVVGTGQASMLLACSLGNRFSIVSVLSPSLRECHDRQLREYGLSDRCSSMRFVTSASEMATIADPDGWYAGMRSRRADMVERIGAQIRAAVDDDGADSVILGCTCMVPVAQDVATYTAAPVINPLDAAFLHAAMLVRMGLSQSPSCFLPAETSRAAVLRAMVKGAAATMSAEAVDDETACGNTCEILSAPDREVVAGAR